MLRNSSRRLDFGRRGTFRLEVSMDVDWQRLPHITWLPRSIGVTPPD